MLLFVMVMVGVAGVAFMLLQALSGPSASKAVKRRMELLKERHAEGALAANAQAQIRKLLSQRASGGMIEGWFSTIVPKPALLRKRLEMTGKSITLGKYSMACAGLFAFVVLGLTMRGFPFVLAVFLGLFVGIGLPHFVIGKMITRRVAKFNSNFPDAIELMVRGLRSGLPITETLGIVAGELPGPVGIEFRAVSDKMKIGRTMEAALQETADRLGTAEFQFFVITLAIQRETGGNLAETLSNLADVLRKRAQMKLKIRAMSSESKASAYIVGSLPFIVFTLVWMINPDYMNNFFTDQRLIVAGLGGLVWMSIGAFIMMKMVNFEI
ncbi:MAG TPA: type II secretion system F family protein [Sphingomicrobium sp.]|nr:type II secretion system F family protein [Sphingomicrobium sp.]